MGNPRYALAKHIINEIKEIYSIDEYFGALNYVLSLNHFEDEDIVWCLQNPIRALPPGSYEKWLYTRCSLDLIRYGSSKVRRRVFSQAMEEINQNEKEK